MAQPSEQSHPDPAWRRRDFVAAACLFAATAAVVRWQNAHVAVLWDLGYVLDSATRMAQGQIPYRDFPFAHAPLTFLIQAAIIRLTGRVFLHSVYYCAAVGGLGTVLAWRMVLRMLHERLQAAWAVSLLLSAPLCVLGIYSIYPHPNYDCDCAFSILCALWLLQRLGAKGGSRTLAFAAGAAACLPLFFKQNIGLAFLAPVLAALALLLVARMARKTADAPALFAALAGAAAALAAAGLLLHFTVGLGNYIHWTIGFAAHRRMLGLTAMLSVYDEPALLWMLPCVAASLVLLQCRLAKLWWARAAAVALLAAPFLWTLLSLAVYDDADERSDALLALWPLLLVLSASLTLFNLRRGITLRALLPAIVLLTINGTFMSQQLWGSTYAIWPLLVLLLAEMIAYLAKLTLPGHALTLVITAVISVALVVCGGFYTASEERLSYAQFPDGPPVHATFPQLKGMATPGPYLPEFEDLLRFAAANIPASGGIVLLPGEEPFFFASGRAPQFPITLFDPATDPYSPAEVVEQARAHHIRWLIVKRDLQIKVDPTPQGDAVRRALLADFAFCARLQGYDVYRRP